MDRKKVGIWGETEACKYLENLDCAIISRNFHCRWGEIDIIAHDGEYTVFVEVKTRSNRRFANPCEFVDRKKQQKIMKSALYYMQKNNQDTAVRFDVIEILYHVKNEVFHLAELNHIKNAFWEE